MLAVLFVFGLGVAVGVQWHVQLSAWWHLARAFVRSRLCAALVLVALAASSVHATPIDDAVAAYKSGTTVYVAPGSELPIGWRRLATEIGKGTVPIFIAVLPAQPNPEEVPLAIGRQLPVTTTTRSGTTWC